MLINISGLNAVALGGEPLQGFGGYSPTFAGNDFYCCLLLDFSEEKVNCYKNKRPPRWPKMADHVLSILPSTLCATTALCGKLI